MFTDYNIILSGSLHLCVNAIAKAHAPVWRCELADILSRAFTCNDFDRMARKLSMLWVQRYYYSLRHPNIWKYFLWTHCIFRIKNTLLSVKLTLAAQCMTQSAKQFLRLLD